MFVNKQTVPALTCPYNYRHRMMTILFLLQPWHGYRFIFTQGHSAFLADAASLASFSPKMSSCRKSVFRFAVTDYMYVAASCLHSGRFFWNLFWTAIQALLFYFERKLYFFLTRKTVFLKNSPKLYFFRISIDNLRPYMCYVIFIQELLFVKYYLFLIDSLFLLLLMQQEHHYLFWDLLQFSLQKLYKYRFLLDELRTRIWIVLTAHLFVLGNLL